MWNETALFEVSRLRDARLYVRVYDHDLFSSDDFLGKTQVRVASLPEDTIKQHSYRLRGDEDTPNVSGTVTLEFLYNREDSDDEGDGERGGGNKQETASTKFVCSVCRKRYVDSENNKEACVYHRNVINVPGLDMGYCAACRRVVSETNGCDRSEHIPKRDLAGMRVRANTVQERVPQMPVTLGELPADLSQRHLVKTSTRSSSGQHGHAHGYARNSSSGGGGGMPAVKSLSIGSLSMSEMSLRSALNSSIESVADEPPDPFEALRVPVYRKQSAVFDDEHMTDWRKMMAEGADNLLLKLGKGAVGLAVNTVTDVKDMVVDVGNTLNPRYEKPADKPSKPGFFTLSRWQQKGKKIIWDLGHVQPENFIMDLKVVRRAVLYNAKLINDLHTRYLTDVEAGDNISTEIEKVRVTLEDLREEELEIIELLKEGGWSIDDIERAASGTSWKRDPDGQHPGSAGAGGGGSGDGSGTTTPLVNSTQPLARGDGGGGGTIGAGGGSSSSTPIAWVRDKVGLGPTKSNLGVGVSNLDYEDTSDEEGGFF